MVIRRKSRTITSNTSFRICFLAGASSFALAAVVATVSAPTVQADARSSVPAAVEQPAQTATPNSLQAKAAPAKPKTSFLRGIASWYGSVLDGHRTASGERFDMFAMTACHPTLPFGTLVRVINLNTRKSVVVRINDRGQLDKGRVIDLSYAAAEELRMTKAGLAPVALQVIALGPSSRRH
jgi:rare lipoprotein A